MALLHGRTPSVEDLEAPDPRELVEWKAETTIGGEAGARRPGAAFIDASMVYGSGVVFRSPEGSKPGGAGDG